jgi:hypothetical protein
MTRFRVNEQWCVQAHTLPMAACRVRVARTVFLVEIHYRNARLPGGSKGEYL